MDVAGALKSIVSPTTVCRNRSLYQAGRKSDSVVEGLAPKSEKTTTLAESNDLAPGIVELSLSPAQGDMKVGEKRQLAWP